MISIDVRSNRLPELRRRFPDALDRIVRDQVFQTQSDAQDNIVKYDVIDTGNMLNSTKGEMTGFAEGQVTCSAQSGSGHPYPVYQNFGTRFMPASPFMSDAADVARTEFPEEFRKLEALL